MRWRNILLSYCAVFALGCQTVPDDYDRPARIVNADDASRAALRTTVKNALGTPVTLSDSALTDSSLLTIENMPPPTMENPVPNGRVLSMPIQFRLVINGGDCVLVNQQDRSRHWLPDTTCEAEM
jgi:hypothetical protein